MPDLPDHQSPALPGFVFSAILKEGSDGMTRPGRGGVTMYKPRIF
jgi:hypothetical protein